MCCDTKQKIAQALCQLMLERPLKKITVQDLMERTQMKRQTFYYHFQDIYDVLVWICRRQLVEPLEAGVRVFLEALLRASFTRGFSLTFPTMPCTSAAFMTPFMSWALNLPWPRLLLALCVFSAVAQAYEVGRWQ